MIIAKFGGTSVATKERVLTLCKIVESELEKEPVVVVSAIRGVTDLLLSGGSIREIRKLHKDLITSLWSNRRIQKEALQYIDSRLKEVTILRLNKNFTKETLDKIASYGEIMSSFIVTKVLQNRGMKVVQVIATDLIITNNNFGTAEFLIGPTKKNTRKVLLPLLKNGIVPVVTGFIGSTKSGQITTLGRGGSDYTASIIGFCLKASEIQIWTDVNGILTADPKIVKNAVTVEYVSYDEASELAIMGAKVLHPKAIFPAVECNIPVRILNTYNPDHVGTVILKEVAKLSHITSIVCKNNIQVINIHTPKMYGTYGFLYKICGIFTKLKISIDFIATSEISISLTINGKYQVTKLVEELEKLAEVGVQTNRSSVSVVGQSSGIDPIIPGRFYTLLEKSRIDVEMISAGASKINETIVVKEKYADDVIRIFHKAFFGV